ncbi:30S ribosomal protein 2 chloroplastic [Phtheirospermum japonicum]|uniref:Small ribosomal subunit protein cS22 n=1 Tax=Phtheirospermum japonicum TaxID=374723 RepID=A0A830DJC1_9LAMI|nr:30S ribosomal protein 2 chloroplastic [Phtheirospermum japonicum]
MATFSSSSSFLIPRNFLQNPAKPFKTHLSKLSFQPLKLQSVPLKSTPRRLNAVAEDTSVATADPSSVAARRLYIGNIPRTVTNDDLQKIVEEHGAVEKAEVMYDKYSGRSRRFAFVTMRTVEDANAASEKLNGTEVGGREIKVNITEKPLTPLEMSLLQAEESQFVDSPYKVYVGNLAKTVTMDTLKDFFAAKGKVVSAKISRVPGTSKSSGYGFVSFGSEEDVEAAISSLNNAVCFFHPSCLFKGFTSILHELV